MTIDEYVTINDSKQFISIRTINENNPVLLYIHGGPGDAALPLVSKYNKQLEEIFTVVIWEQRGAGKSYYHFSQEENISIDTFVDDTHALCVDLLSRFKKEKLYLVGHSWGSVIGLKFVQMYPELVHTFVGCGQVVNMIKSCKIAYEFALQKNIEANNNRIVRKLNKVDCTYKKPSWLTDLLFVTGQVVKHGGSFYDKKNVHIFVLDFLLSSYGLKNLINRQKGSLQSLKRFWQELMTVDFESFTNFKTPLVFIEGRYDHQVSATLVHDYFEKIETEKQFYWFEKSAHCPQWEEPERFYEIMKSVLVLN